MNSWPNRNQVAGGGYRNLGYIQAAVARPFQTVFGRPAYATLAEKGAALFHSLIANHPFENGNKRTAVLVLDLFMYANNHYLAIADPDGVMYRLAMDTASYNERGVTHDAMLARIVTVVRERLIPFRQLAVANPRLYEIARKAARNVRRVNGLVSGVADTLGGQT